MSVTVVAVLCHLLVAHPTLAPNRDCTSEEAVVEEIVTDSDLTPDLTMISCQMSGQAPVAAWKLAHPIYRSNMWRVARVGCIDGRYEIKGRI